MSTFLYFAYGSNMSTRRLTHAERAPSARFVTAEGEMAALAYVATDKRPGLPVYDWYREHVVRGAREHGLPEDYVAAIRRIEVVSDPRPGQADGELAIYRSGGAKA